VFTQCGRLWTAPARQSPHLGLHGASLGLSIGLAGFVVGALGVRQTMLSRPTAVRVYGPFLALLLLSSALLLWAQPTGPGASGCIVAIWPVSCAPT